MFACGDALPLQLIPIDSSCVPPRSGSYRQVTEMTHLVIEVCRILIVLVQRRAQG